MAESAKGVSSEAALGAVEAPRESDPAPATLLLIVGEPFNIDQKDLILERIVTELLGWDSELAKCDVDEQLGAFARQQPKACDGANGEKIFNLQSAQLRVTVLLNARVQTVREHVQSFLLVRSAYRHLLYSGLALHGSDCWILQDGIFSCSSLSELFHRPDVAEAAKQVPGATIDISVLSEGGRWKEEALKQLAPGLRIRLNPPKNQKNEEGVIQFTDILSISLKAPSSVELLPATDVVGSLAFQRPTLYIFPAGSGDCAFFGVGGFNLLVNGGYGRRSCFWPLVRHLVRIDAVLVSHIGPENIFGISSLFERKAVESTPPDLGMVYLNIGDTKPVAPNGALPVSTGLLVSLADEGASIVDHLRHVGMSVHPCIGSLVGQTLQSINLYFKVGYGSLDLYILNPLNGKELKDFLGSWARNINNAKNGAPLSDEQSICSLLVWKPASPAEKIVRVLFPGNTPQSKILDGIDRLKNVALFQSATGVSEKPEGKVVDRKPPPGAGKPSSGRQVAPPVETEHKKPVEVALEQKAPVTEQKDLKKSAEHREVKRPADSKPPGKGGLESKAKSEPKEQKPPGKSMPQAKRNEGKPGTSEHKEAKASGKPEVDTKKTEIKSNHKEAKSLGRQDVEAKKGDVKKPAEPKEGKKVPGSEQKDSKRVSAVTHAAAAETKESKTPATKHDSAPGKVSSKVTEKAAKDAKNKKVVKETQDTKTPTKKGSTFRDFPMPSIVSSGKEQKQQEPTVEVKEGQKTEKPAPSADVGKILPGLDSVEIKNATAEEEQVKNEAKEPDAVSSAEIKVGGNQVEKLPEALAAYQVKEESEHEHLLSPDVKSGIEQELQNILDQPEPAKTEPDPVLPDLPTLEGSILAMDSAHAEEEDIANLSLSLSEKPSTEPVNEADPVLSQLAPEVADCLSAGEISQEAEPLLDFSVSKQAAVEMPEPEANKSPVEKVVEQAEPSLDHVAAREEHSMVEPSSDAGDVKDEPSMHVIQSLSKEIVKNAISSAVQSHFSEVGESSEIPEKIKSVAVEPGDVADLEEPVEILHKVSDILISPEEPTTDSQSSLEEKDVLERLEKEMVAADDTPSDERDSEPVVGKFIEKDKVGEEISAKSSKAEGHFAAGERGIADDPEDVNFQKTGKFLPEAGEGEKTEVEQDEQSLDLHKNRQKEGEWIPMEKEDGLPPVAENLLEDPDEEESFDEGDRSYEDEEVSINEEAPFDPQAKWGQPEGLPAPLNGRKENGGKKDNQSVLQTSASSSKNPSSQAASGKKNDGKDSAKRPSAAAETPAKKPGDEGTKLASGRGGSASGTQKKVRAAEASFRESSTKTSHVPETKKTAAKSIVPLHVDLAYVPSHGDARRFDADFFRAVRARYYVLSSAEPDPEALSLLLDAKESWATRVDETTVIPTYDSSRLAAWIAINQERLNRLRVVVAPSASRSTVQLNEHEANCPAYRLEF